MIWYLDGEHGRWRSEGVTGKWYLCLQRPLPLNLSWLRHSPKYILPHNSGHTYTHIHICKWIQKLTAQYTLTFSVLFDAHFFCTILPSSGTGSALRGNMKWKYISYSGTGIFLHQIFAVGTQDPVNCQADRGLVTIWQSLAMSLLWTSVYSLSRRGERSPVIRRGDFTNSISQVKSPFRVLPQPYSVRNPENEISSGSQP